MGLKILNVGESIINPYPKKGII